MAKDLDLPWLRINSFSQLKMLLIETILTTLVIVFATTVIKEEGRLQWNDILIPVAVFFWLSPLNLLRTNDIEDLIISPATSFQTALTYIVSATGRYSVFQSNLNSLKLFFKEFTTRVNAHFY